MKCSKCNNKAIYERKWEGRAYCGSCLSEQVERKVKQTIRENNLIEKGEIIAVGLSGGKDSTTLLYILHKYFSKTNQIIAISIDEGIEGYRNETLERAKKLACVLGIEHKIFSYKKIFGINLDEIPEILGEKQKINWCTWCGVFRRYILNQAAKAINADKLAVGHNLDDEVQGIFMNFFKGDLSRFQRLGAKPGIIGSKKFVQRIKPFFEILEKEILIYAMINGIPFSNAECPHSEEIMRRTTAEMINKLEFEYPGTKFQILNFYEKLRPFMTAVEIKENIRSCENCGEPTSRTNCMACELFDKLNLNLIEKSLQ